MAAQQGYFKPRNPKKYKGDPTNIVYRSSWERIFMTFLDNSSDILEWGSEEMIIPYYDQLSKKMRRYFPDFKIKKKLENGNEEINIIEIKPRKQTIKPIMKTKKPTKSFLNEMQTYIVNTQKWDAAEKYCNKNGYKFMILDEYSLGIKK
jgi:hypothetical protein